MALLGGCHADECTWRVDRAVSDATVTLTRSGVPLAATVEYAAVSSFRSEDVPSRAQVTASIAVANDAQIQTASLVINVPHALEPSEPLAQLSARFRLVQGMTIVSEGAASGTLAFTLSEVRCEENDPSGWSCGTNADATIEATYEDYALAVTISQRETMHEMCRSCDGIEGCNY